MSVQVAICQPSSTGLKFGLDYNHFALRGPGVKAEFMYGLNPIDVGLSIQYNSIRDKAQSPQGTKIFVKTDYLVPGILINWKVLKTENSELGIGFHFRKYFFTNYERTVENPTTGYYSHVECSNCPYDSPSGEAYSFPDIAQFQFGTELRYLYQLKPKLSVLIGIEGFTYFSDAYIYDPYHFNSIRYMWFNLAGNIGFVYHVKPF